MFKAAFLCYNSTNDVKGGDKMDVSELCMQYMLRRHEVDALADAYADALEEDHLKNAEMFDLTRTTFSSNLHPNGRMRELEAELAARDLPLLHLLSALLSVGTDLVLGLADFGNAEALFAALAAEYTRAEQIEDTAVLAHRLTEPKAEHQLKRLCRVREALTHQGY